MASDPSLTPDLVEARSFTSGFRGYDQAEVRAFLGRVAAELRGLRERVDGLESAWHSAEERAARPPVLDEETLIAAVGEETAAILRAARTAAADLRTRAADEAARIVAEAQTLATRIQSEAETVLARETRTAEDAAARLVEAARSEAAEMVEKARIEGDAMRVAARQERSLTVEGAIATRERILDDLARRRRVASVQIEQLRAGRERLLESYAVVRRTLEEVNDELNRADGEARAAADEVGRRMQREHPRDLAGIAGTHREEGAAGSPGPESAGGAATGSPGPESPGAAAQDPDAAAAGTHGPRPAGEPGEANESGAADDVIDGSGSDADRSPSDPRPPRSEQPPEPASGLLPSPGGRGGPGAAAGRAVGETGPGSEARAAVMQPVQDDRLADHGAGPRLRLVPETGAVPLTEGDIDQAARAEAGPALGAEASSGAHVDLLFARIRADREGPDAQPNGASDEPGAGASASAPASGAGPAAGASAAGAGSATLVAGAPAPAAGDAGDPGDRAPGADPAPPAGPDEILLQRRQAVVGELETSLTRRLKRALQDEQNDLLDRLRSLNEEPTVVSLLPAFSDQIAHYAAAAQPLLDAAATGGVAFAVEVLDDQSAADHDRPAVAQVTDVTEMTGATDATDVTDVTDVTDLAEEAAITIVESLRRRLEHAVSTSAGDEQQVLIAAVGSAYREWKSERIERIAGDVMAAAFSRGTWHHVPDGTLLRWVVKDADGPCPDCDDDVLAGTLPKGEPFPTGQPHPPAHPGCRCLLVPVAV